MNPNGYNEDKCIVIVSNILELPAKVIFSSNQVLAAGRFYDDKQRKLGGKQWLVTTDSRESHVFISDRLDYLPAIFPTNEEMEPYPKVPLNPAG